MVVTDPRLGTQIAGYRLEQVLGRGGMSVVYLAEDLRLGRRVALKLLAPELSADERFRDRFLRESRIAASLDHSHVVPVYEAGEADGQLYIAMRYVEGTSLKRLLTSEGPLDPERTLDIAAQVAAALDHAHGRGLVHRDVKPANVLVAREEGTDVAYLADFGLTRPTASETALTEADRFAGTADYIAPEQIEQKPLDGRADVYSLGCLVYECLTGRPPFGGDSLMSLLWAHVNERAPLVSARREGLPTELDRVLAKALAKSPKARYRTCSAFVHDARAVLASGWRGRLRALAWRRRRALVLAGGAALAAAIGSALLLAGGGSAAPDGPAVVRIDPGTNTLVASIPVGRSISRVAAGEQGVWALDWERGSFVRIDPRRNAVLGRGSTLGESVSIALGVGSVWIANREGSTASAGTVLEIDPRRPGRAHAFTVPVRQQVPRQPAFSDLAASDLPGARAVWVVNPAGLSVKRLNPLGTLAASIPVGPSPPRWVAVAPGAVWVAQAWALARIDPEANRVVASIPLPFTPRGIAAGFGRVWLTHNFANEVWVLDPATNRVVRRIRVGREPTGIAVGFGSVWTANRLDGTVSRIEPRTGRVLETIEVGGRPESVAAGAGGVWIGTYNLPERRLAPSEYEAAVKRIHDRMYWLAADVNLPAIQFYIGSTRTLVPTVARQFALLNEQLGEEIGELDPPDRFVADQRRYLAGLRKVGGLYPRAAEAFSTGNSGLIDQALGEIAAEWIRVRSELSEEFRRLFPPYPLTQA